MLHGLVAAIILVTLSTTGTASSQDAPGAISQVTEGAVPGKAGPKLPSIEDEMLQAIQRTSPERAVPEGRKSGSQAQQAVETIQRPVRAIREAEPRGAGRDTSASQSMNVTQFHQTVHDLRVDYIKLKKEHEQLKQVIERLNQRHDRLQSAYNSLLDNLNQAMADYEEIRAYRNGGGPRLYGLDTPSPLLRASRPSGTSSPSPAADSVTGLGRQTEPAGRAARFPPDFTN